MGRTTPAVLLFLLPVLSALGQGFSSTVHIDPGDPPVLVLRPPLERWRLQLTPEPGEPKFRCSLIDTEFGNRVDLWSLDREASTDGLVARRIAESFRSSFNAPGELVRSLEIFGLDERDRAVWRFEAESSDPTLGLILHEVWQLDLSGRTVVVVFRSPGPSHQGSGREVSDSALDYIRGAIGPLGVER